MENLRSPFPIEMNINSPVSLEVGKMIKVFIPAIKQVKIENVIEFSGEPKIGYPLNHNTKCNKSNLA